MHYIRISEQPAPVSAPTAGNDFQISYTAVNDSSSETPSGGHKDYIAIVGPGGTSVFERWFEQEQVPANGAYAVYLDIPGQPAGDYLISVSLEPDSNHDEQGAGNFTVS